MKNIFTLVLVLLFSMNISAIGLNHLPDDAKQKVVKFEKSAIDSVQTISINIQDVAEAIPIFPKENILFKNLPNAPVNFSVTVPVDSDTGINVSKPNTLIDVGNLVKQHWQSNKTYFNSTKTDNLFKPIQSIETYINNTSHIPLNWCLSVTNNTSFRS